MAFESIVDWYQERYYRFRVEGPEGMGACDGGKRVVMLWRRRSRRMQVNHSMDG
jgi:hypothetical protein